MQQTARKPVIMNGSLASRPPLGLIYLLLVVPIGLLMIFNYIPALWAMGGAFFDWDIGRERRFNGLDNFIRLAQDEVFRQSLWNLLRLGSFVLIVNLTVPFLVAEMIFHLASERWRYLCRVALVIPMLIPGVIYTMIWGQGIYSDAGILTEFLNLIGLQGWVRGWLSEPNTALWAIACLGFPFAHGFNVLIYYAGLNNISTDVLEAAEVDGLSKLGRILHIHVPLVAQQFKLLMIVTVIGVVNGFEGVLILTGDGGPGYETMLPGLYMYQNGFTYQRMGYACSIGLLMLLFLLTFTILVNRFWRTEKFQPGARRA